MIAVYQKILGLFVCLMITSSIFAAPATLSPDLTLPAPTFQQTMIATNVSALDNQHLSEQLFTLQKNFTNYQQQTNQRLQLLQQQAGVMQIEISQLTGFIQMLKEEFNHLEKTITAEFQNTKPVRSFGNLANLNFSQNKLLGFIIILSLILIVWVWMPSSQKKSMPKRQEPKITYDKNEEEYDFMASQEAIPAKLDLARSYIAMEDFAAAKKILKEITRQGNIMEKQQAKQLLGNC